MTLGFAMIQAGMAFILRQSMPYDGQDLNILLEQINRYSTATPVECAENLL